MTTPWTKQTSVATSAWTIAPPLQNDLWAGLDELLNIMTDEDDNIILFHNGDYYSQDTIWTTI